MTFYSLICLSVCGVPILFYCSVSDIFLSRQMTIDGVKRTAQEQVNRALKDQARFVTLSAS